MSAPESDDPIDAIGQAAGAVWEYLHTNGPTAVSRLCKEVDSGRDTTLQGVGWLAREGKIRFVEGPRKTRLLQLADS